MTDINPCRHCRKIPSDGYYPGDYAIECDDCKSFISRHMVDYPGLTFLKREKQAKAAAIEEWNKLNPPTTT